MIAPTTRRPRFPENVIPFIPGVCLAVALMILGLWTADFVGHQLLTWLGLAGIVPLLAYRHFQTTQATSSTKVSISKLFPLFVLGFIGMAIFRSIGDVAWSSPAWKDLTNQIGDVWGSRYLLGSAMAAVGLGTSFSVFRGVGIRPFLVGFLGALIVGATGFGMAFLLGGWLHF